MRSKSHKHLSVTRWERGIFPDALKIAKVVPIFKSDDKMAISNYRPIGYIGLIDILKNL